MLPGIVFFVVSNYPAHNLGWLLHGWLLMMCVKNLKLISAVILLFMVSSCDKLDEQHKDTIEDRLIYSFRHEAPELQNTVEEIVRRAKEKNYQDALNKLALLSATHKLNKNQKHAVDTIMKQLRYDMEEEIFSEKKAQEKSGE